MGAVRTQVFEYTLCYGLLYLRYHGGWVAPNIYFLGHAGCIQVNGIRIAGVSGIFKAGDFAMGMWRQGLVEAMHEANIVQVTRKDCPIIAVQCEVSIILANTTSVVYHW